MRQVAVVGQRQRLAGGAQRESPDEEQGAARRCVEQVGVRRRWPLPRSSVCRTMSIRARAVAVSPRCRPSASARLRAPASAAGTHSCDQVQRRAVDRADRPAGQHLGPGLEPQRLGDRGGRRRVAEGPTTWRATDLPAAATADSACRKVPSASDWWNDARCDEPARAAAALDQPLVAELLEGPAHGHPAHAVARARARPRSPARRPGRASPSAIRSRSCCASARGPGTCHARTIQV